MESIYGYTNIVKVYETDYESRANLYLDLGWVLLTVLTFNHGGTDSLNQSVRYVLGWDKNSGDVQVPEDNFKLPF